MTNEERVQDLRSAVQRADTVLEWILGDQGYPERMLTTAKRVRRILRAALNRTEDKAAGEAAPGSASTPKQKKKSGKFADWQLRGLTKELK